LLLHVMSTKDKDTNQFSALAAAQHSLQDDTAIKSISEIARSGAAIFTWALRFSDGISFEASCMCGHFCTQYRTLLGRPVSKPAEFFCPPCHVTAALLNHGHGERALREKLKGGGPGVSYNGTLRMLKFSAFVRELTEPARPAAARPASRDASGPEPGGASALRTERRRRIEGPAATYLPGLATADSVTDSS
jgi:hypothetical protein